MEATLSAEGAAERPGGPPEGGARGRLHELRTWPEFFEAVRRGEKRHDLRRDDRGFRAGDVLLLVEYDPEAERETGRRLRALVTYVSTPESLGALCGLREGFAILSVAPLPLPARG